MTFGELKSKAIEYLDVDGNRRGTTLLRDNAIQSAMVDLQRFSPPLRFNSRIKVSFADGDVLTYFWGAEVAEAIAEFVKAKMVRRYDRDGRRADEHFSEYSRLRLAIYREAKALQEQINEELSMLNAKTVPLLTDITTRTGGGPTALDGLVTLYTEPPRMVDIIIGNNSERWLLRADPSNTSADGEYVVQPTDYNSTSNAKKWFRQ